MRFFVYPYVVWTQYQKFKDLIAFFKLETYDEFRCCPDVQELSQRYSLTDVSVKEIWNDLSEWTPNHMVIHVTCPSPSSLPFCTWKDLSAALSQVESTIGLRFLKMTRVRCHSMYNMMHWRIEFFRKDLGAFGEKHPLLVEKANTPFFQSA